MNETRRAAAVFLDFENIYFGFLHQGENSEPDKKLTLDKVLLLLSRLREELADRGENLVLGRSYSSFDEYPGSDAALPLSLMGFDPQYVVKFRGKNSADLALSLDLLEVLLTRKDIGLFVIVGGDRDYIPVSRKVLEAGRDLLIVSLEDSTSGDLVDRVGKDRFVNALRLLETRGVLSGAAAESGEVRVEDEDSGNGHPREPKEPPDEAEARAREVRAEPRRHRTVGHRGARVLGRIELGHGSRWSPISDEEACGEENRRKLIRLLEELTDRYLEKAQSNEIWLGPLLKREMTEVFPRLSHPQRRRLVNLLKEEGVIRIEERQSQTGPHPYSVVILNPEEDGEEEGDGEREESEVRETT